MNKLKDLNDRLGAKKLEARNLITSAETAKRDLTVEERSKVSAIQTDCEGISEQIMIEARQLALEGAKGPKLNENERRNVESFDFKKLLTHLHRSAKGQPSTIDGFEAEMIQEGEKEAREACVESGGIVLPRMLVRRRDLTGVQYRDVTATGGTSGDQLGNTIATGKAGILDDFFNQSVIRAAGATVLEGLVGNLDIPRIVAGTAPGKKAENAAADETSPTSAMLSLTPKRLPAYIDISSQLLKQSSSAIEAVLRSTLTNQMLAIQEAAFFHGGGTNEANGIAGTSGIGSVAGGTNGAAPVWSHIVGLETAVDATNALLGNLHYVSNGQIRGKLKQTQLVSGTDSRMILDANSSLLNGYSPFWTNAVSRTLTKGSSSVASAIFFGNFSDYWVGYWSGVSLEMVRDKTNAISDLWTLVANTYYDGGVVRPKSFAAMLDALGA
jgi:HK97 family phage major capsid protein